MKKLILLVAFSAIPLFAAVLLSDVKISNFYGTYVEPIGKGRAKEFVKSSNFLKGIDVEIMKIDQHVLKVQYDNEEVIFEDLPKDIFEMKELDWSDFNLNHTRQSFALSLTELKGKSTQSIAHMKGLKVNCLVTNRNRNNEYDALIKGCIKQGSIDLASFTNNNPRKDNILSIFFYHSLQYPLASQVKVSNLKLTTSSNNFKLTGKVSTSISAKIKASGKVWFNTKNRELKLKLESAKAGIISIKNQIFKELEASEDPKLRVQRPYIYYQTN